MKKVKKTFLLSILLLNMIFLFGASHTPNAYAIDFNDFVLDVKALSHGNDTQGVVPVVAIVTYEGAGVDNLTAENFSIKTDAQLVPDGCSPLTLDANEFKNKGDGTYHLGLRLDETSCKTGTTYYLPLKVDARPGFGIKASGMTVLEIFRFSFDPNFFDLN